MIANVTEAAWAWGSTGRSGLDATNRVGRSAGRLLLTDVISIRLFLASTIATTYQI